MHAGSAEWVIDFGVGRFPESGFEMSVVLGQNAKPAQGCISGFGVGPSSQVRQLHRGVGASVTCFGQGEARSRVLAARGRTVTCAYEVQATDPVRGLMSMHLFSGCVVWHAAYVRRASLPATDFIRTAGAGGLEGAGMEYVEGSRD